MMCREQRTSLQRQLHVFPLFHVVILLCTFNSKRLEVVHRAPVVQAFREQTVIPPSRLPCPSPDPFSSSSSFLLLISFPLLILIRDLFSFLLHSILYPFVLNRSLFLLPPILPLPVWPDPSHFFQVSSAYAIPSFCHPPTCPLPMGTIYTDTPMNYGPIQSIDAMATRQSIVSLRCGNGTNNGQKGKRETLPSSSPTQVKPCCHHS